MKPGRTAAYALLAIAAGVGFAALRPASHTPPAAAHAAVAQGRSMSLHQATAVFLATLTPELRAKATFPFDADERRNWHFVPRARKGVSLREMDDKQRKAALALLAAALSEQGYKKVEAIRTLETVLQEVEGDANGSFRNPGHYSLTVFGTPGARGVWGLRYEGHHIALNWTLIDGRVAASSPQFLGANPATVRTDGPQKGARALAAEEDLGRTFVQALTPGQRAKAVVAESAPSDIVTGARRKVAPPEATGVAYSELDKKQQAALLDLVRVHAAVQARGVAEARMERARKAGLDALRFAWMGGLGPGQGHYYRIQGPAFLIEYDNTQNGANHVHTVWRDFTDDFGDDALVDHYRRFPAGTSVGADHGHAHPHLHDGGAPHHTH